MYNLYNFNYNSQFLRLLFNDHRNFINQRLRDMLCGVGRSKFEPSHGGPSIENQGI